MITRDEKKKKKQQQKTKKNKNKKKKQTKNNGLFIPKDPNRNIMAWNIYLKRLHVYIEYPY